MWPSVVLEHYSRLYFIFLCVLPSQLGSGIVYFAVLYSQMASGEWLCNVGAMRRSCDITIHNYVPIWNAQIMLNKLELLYRNPLIERVYVIRKAIAPRFPWSAAVQHVELMV